MSANESLENKKKENSGLTMPANVQQLLPWGDGRSGIDWCITTSNLSAENKMKRIHFFIRKIWGIFLPDRDPDSLFVDFSGSSDMQEEHPQGRGLLTY